MARGKGGRKPNHRQSTSSESPENGASRAPRRGLSYADAGVGLENYDRFISALGSVLRKTYGPRVIENAGGFAGLFRLDYNEKLFKRNYREPVLVACADGVGTKLKLAAQLGRFDTVGVDLVAMNVNDLIVQGAEPLFFLDYIAVGKVDRAMLLELVTGISNGCRLAGCALLGGETAEMPGLYNPGDFDLAGFSVGVVELSRAVDKTRVEKGDVVLGLASSGVHSNGFSLVRAVIDRAGLDPHEPQPELAGSESVAIPGARGSRSRRRIVHGAEPLAGNGKGAHAPTLGETLLTPTRIYAESIVRLLRAYRVKRIVSGMAHITGGGLAQNLERALHDKVDAVIDRRAWKPPPVFDFLQRAGDVDEEEMRRVFNMGIGYTLIVRPAFANAVAARLRRSGERVHELGRIVKGTGKVRERS